MIKQNTIEGLRERKAEIKYEIGLIENILEIHKSKSMLTKLKSFLKAIWGNIWPTAKQRKPSPESIAWHENIAKKVLSGEITPRDWREENKKLMENYKGFFVPEFTPDQFLRECRDIPDDKELSKYVMGIDPTNGSFHFVNLHGEPITEPSPFLKEQLRIAKEKQLALLKALYYELIELSGDVSEQSVILPKMDEIVHRTECEELLLEYDKCKNRHTAMAFYNHLIGK